MIVEGEEREETRDAPVSVPERMDAQEIQYQTCCRQQWRKQALVNRVTICNAKILDCLGGFGSRNRPEAYPAIPDGVNFDDLVLLAFPLPGVSPTGLREFAQVLESRRLDSRLGMARVNPVQRVSVAHNLLFRAVARPGAPNHERTQAGAIDCDALNPVGRLRALDQRDLPQRTKHLGSLALK